MAMVSASRILSRALRRTQVEGRKGGQGQGMAGKWRKGLPAAMPKTRSRWWRPCGIPRQLR